MNGRRKIGLDDAYSVESPDDNIRLYTSWAGTYDDDFVKANGYVLFRHVAERLAVHQPNRQVPVLDVGCGTGVCGQVLKELGFANVDGVDISRAMLDEAAAKLAGDGSAVYRSLFEADLTASPGLPFSDYGGLVSAGTFTHGHLGPGSLQLLWGFAGPGAIAAVGVNARHYESEGFARAFATAQEAGVLDIVEIAEVDIYLQPPAGLEAGNDRAKVVTCRVR
jgi:SAM-dependent methyltransferase